MSKIKSTLEIAMERAAAMGGGGQDLEQEQGQRQGKALARRLLDRDLSPQELEEQLGRLPEPQQSPARSAAAQALIQALEQGAEQAQAQAIQGLAGLARGGPAQEAAESLVALAQEQQEAEAGLLAQAAQALGQELAKEGIAGSAVRPNPAAYGGLPDQRRQLSDSLTQAWQEALSQVGRVFS